MPNRDIQAAWAYHNGTKHPDGHLMDRGHFFDQSAQPILFKIYPDLEPIPLPVDKSPGTTSALSAISASVHRGPGGESPILSIETLGKILYFSAGITKTISYPWGEMAFRAAACTGALYHIEMYLVCGDLPGLEAGVYHFDVHAMALKRLRAGDHRSRLIEASGQEPAVANAPAIVVCTDVRWRNACKYQAREYRHAFWDCGTILANTLATAASCGVPTQVVLGFIDEQVNHLLGLDSESEVAIALVPLGYSPHQSGPAPEHETPALSPLSLKTLPISDSEIDFPPILEMHNASSLQSVQEVASWRGQFPSAQSPSRSPAMEAAKPSGPVTPPVKVELDQTPSDPIESVITRRGSSRQFSLEPMSFLQLSTMLQLSIKPVPADFLADPGVHLNDLYLIVNNVDGLASGAYVFHREEGTLEQLGVGDFRRHAGVLGLHQDLPADASVNIFYLCDLNAILDKFGNRGYRAAQLEASIAAGRMYLAAYALRLGATGLTFYDDAVIAFFSPHAEEKSVMFLVALGKRARRASHS